MPLPTRALIRRPPASYVDFYARLGVEVDLALALRQHQAYADALIASGLTVTAVPPDEHFPDGVFIEDTGVVWEGRLLVSRMTAHREGEQAGTRATLAASHQILEMPAAARLDGGDVLHADTVTYVGRSSRTNAAGAAALRHFLAPRPVIEVPVERCLHLKTAATWLGNGTMFAAEELLDLSIFKDHRIIRTPPGEAHAANTLRIGRSLLYRDSFAASATLLRNFAAEHGLIPRKLGMSEFEKGDGSLTCLSIIMTESPEP